MNNYVPKTRILSNALHALLNTAFATDDWLWLGIYSPEMAAAFIQAATELGVGAYIAPPTDDYARAAGEVSLMAENGDLSAVWQRAYEICPKD